MDIDKKGLWGTILFHAIILILFLVFGFKTQLPLPGEAGIEVNFGDMDDAYGEAEPRYNEQSQPQQQEHVPQPVQQEAIEETVMTQDTEEAPAIEQNKKPELKPQEKPKETVQKPVPEKEEPREEEKLKPNPRALYSGRKNDTQYSGSQGTTTGTGNQGTQTGNPDATSLGLGGGSGNSPGFYLSGRNALHLPTPVLDAPKQGKVVVEIKVNRQGEVVEATPGVKGSTTLDSYLLEIAKKSALASKFDSKPDAPFFQTGTITYIFSLK